MKQIEDNVSVFIQQQFPAFYKEQGPIFIEFVKEYFNWLQQANNTLYYTRNLLEYRDIDNTVDDFLVHFKKKYLENFTLENGTDIRWNTKNVLDIYRAKGTSRSVDLLFKTLYGEGDATTYFPGKDIIRASDGEWFVPIYLECTLSTKTNTFTSKEIIGSVSGAKAFVEGVNRKSINGKYFDVVYLSNLRGNFQFGELITVDGDLTDSPKIIGSLTRVTLIDSGRDFNIGDVLDIVSDQLGKQGKARVESIENATGRVTFNLIDGGTGYRTQANPLVSEKVLVLTNITSSNVYANNFSVDETVRQPLSNVQFISGNNFFNHGEEIIGFISPNSVNIVATGRIVGLNQNTAANGNLLIIVNSGNFATADSIRANVASNTSALISTHANETATGKVIGVNAQAIGITNVVNTFTANNYNFIFSNTSNVYANVTLIGVGTGANFDIGLLTDTESIFLNTDLIGGNNSINEPYLTIQLDGSNSGVGFVSSIIIGAGGTAYSNSDPVVIEGGGRRVGRIQINAGGTGYTNGNLLTFTGSGSGANAFITTNSTGGITSLTVTNSGNGYVTVPSVTAPGGTGANLTAVMIATTNATATLQTNSTGGITTVTVTNTGSGFYYTPTVTVTSGTGSGASLSANMYFGYGFPKAPLGNKDTILNLVLTRSSFTIGTIASLANVNPGTGYTANPFVLVRDDLIAGFNRRNLHLDLSNVAGTFVVGEEITQNFSTPAMTLNIGGSASVFEVTETVTQQINATSNAYGEVANSSLTQTTINTTDTFVVSTNVDLTGTVSSNTTSPLVTGVGTLFTTELANGNFIKFSGNNFLFKVNAITNSTSLTLTTNAALTTANNVKKFSNVLVGMTSNNYAYVNVAVSNAQISISRGTVLNVNNNTSIDIRRKSFNTSFTSSVPITGVLSSATANVIGATQISNSSLMGNNAIVNAVAGVVNGSIVSTNIIDSGFAYEDGEQVTLSTGNNQFVAIAYANLINQGIGEGYFKSTRGFLNSDKYIHDGDFYQEYSYQVRSSIPFDKYSDTLKSLLHVAGTKLFGNIIKVSEGNTQLTVNNTVNAITLGIDTKPGARALNFTVYTPATQIIYNIAVPVGALIITPTSPVVNSNYSFVVPAGTTSITSQQHSIGFNFEVGSDTISLTGQSIIYNIGFSMPSGTTTITGQTPTISIA